MSQSELAFLAAGLVLGAAGGTALIVLLGSRPRRREVRVTVTHDAIPRRSGTLAMSSAVANPGGPAPGGPGDRRGDERADARPLDRPPMVAVGPGQPGEIPGVRTPVASPSAPPRDRTIVPSRPAAGEPGAALSASAIAGATAVAVQASTDPHVGVAVATPGGPLIRRILRGDHLALLEVVDALAALEDRERREWEVLLTGLGAAIAETAVDEGILEFPMGNAFWDAFTVEQCREISASLASMGHRFDGGGGWVDGRAPDYRELGQALADIGVDPRRVRIWPNSSEIAELYRGARPAADDLIARDAPDLALESVKELTRWHAESLAGLWVAWETVRPRLLAETVTARPRG